MSFNHETTSSRRRVILGAIVGAMLLPTLVMCVFWGHILRTWLFPPARPVFGEALYLGPDYRWGWPFAFQDTQKNVFFVDRELNIVLVILSESPLIDARNPRPVFMSRPDSIELWNNDDRAICVKVDLQRDRCYFVGQDMIATAASMPSSDVAGILKAKANKEMKSDESVELNITEELEAFGLHRTEDCR